MRYRHLVVLLLLIAATPASAQDKAADSVLFDFEDGAGMKAWSNLELPGAKAKEPAVTIERATDHATAGKHSLKLTFAGGRWPTVTTTQVPDDWTAFKTFHADVTVSRPCLVGFSVLQEKSRRGEGWDANISRWTKTALLRPGLNHVTASIPQPNDYAIHAKWGKVVRFEIFLYEPRDGEAVYVDNIRLSAKKEDAPPAKTQFTLAGSDTVLSGTTSAQAVIELGKKSKDRWLKPESKTVAQVEDGFRARFAELKKTHPRAVLAVLRDGEKGYDPANPDRPFAGWKDAHIDSHGPDAACVERATNRGKAASQEIFMRHRSVLMRVDLVSIPAGSTILDARLLIVRANDKILDDHDPTKKPTMWVVEPCNRPWIENEVNAYEYARGKFWKAVGGMNWGDDPDFLPIFLAHGPGQGKANVWDFTAAVRFWTDGKHANRGFMLHGDSHDYITAASREAPEVRNRPAVLAIYEPKE